MFKKKKPDHPGHILREELLEPLGITITRAAKDLGVSRQALSDFLNERSPLSPEMAVRIAKATDSSPETWIKMQTKLDLWEAEQKELKVSPFLSVAANFIPGY